MPSVAKRPCLKAGCPALVDKGYCEQHASIFQQQRERWRGSSSSRGYNSAWQRVRLQALKRDDYLCVNCKVKYNRVTPARSVHHLKKITTHPHLRLDLGNLLSCCDPCHKELEQVAQ